MPGRLRKPSWPRIYRRAGAPAAWWLQDAPRRTLPGDAGDVADLTGQLPAGARQGGCAWTTGDRGACLNFTRASSGWVRADGPIFAGGSYSILARVFVRSYQPNTGSPDYSTATAFDAANGTYGSVHGLAVLNNPGQANAYVNWSGGIDPGQRAYVTGNAVPLNRWQSLAATFDGGTLRLYQDGALTASGAAPAPAQPITQAALGKFRGDTLGGYFDGLIDDVRFYPRCLSAGEIARYQVDPYWRLRPAGTGPDPVTLAGLAGPGATVFTAAASGGAAVGGFAGFAGVWSPSAGGGPVPGGAAPTSPAWSPPAAGGAPLGAAAAPAPAWSPAGSGGILAAGTAAPAAGLTAAAAGGVLLGGTLTPAPAWSPAASGGPELAGTAGTSTGSSVQGAAAAGGPVLGGTAPAPGLSWALTGSAGIDLGGAGATRPTWSPPAAGGIDLGGTAPAGSHTTFTAPTSGGAALGGGSPGSVTYTPAAAAELRFGGAAAWGVTWSGRSDGGLELGGVALIAPTNVRTPDPARATAARVGPDPRRATAARSGPDASRSSSSRL